ncbi:ABC transporter ATP-binding protein [Listeria cossartiae subsp. cayugensis]|uniref:ABC transporter ATP-binding protein n=1 Tax=Listeria cossartiae subsp. cayugensis TaxID=2713505 RepID=A0ABU2IML9_9LIST|nr:ABC transporter ATP-binding protein [Listeria cossartiae]MDT0049430.1 ABC transporter ATP-binding protein [Listeria cossartiae subsp. cayugensis]MDT0065933.1 ABC transporter ATP-binding protein [Listeria cossartiae subsp. cayugensis]MDT0078463.1 ABC transporter ATP-binding protein [Listeria cossartiae subsp. cayugensis]MDT0081299.1 ABC transporter ATP-binding protein [Listeria cossartiae subsp. cayugensis]MDT0088166.1 ABC transporter ATP-binding protein [Listeria cossartiae subsp. cayugensi
MEGINLNIHNLKKQYEDKTIINNLSITINFNSKITLVTGMNGSGKSTLAKMIAGIILPDKGTLTLSNHTNFSKWTKRNTYYLSNAERGMFYKLNCRQNIEYLTSLKGTSRKYVLDKLPAYCEKLNCTDILEISAEKLSTGQKKKVFILSALCSNCQLLLLDEPTNGLDDESFCAFTEILASLRPEKKIVLISHDKRFLDMPHIERIIFGKNGEIYWEEGSANGLS